MAARSDRRNPHRLARIAGGFAVLVSVLLALVLLLGREGLNPLNAVTLIGGLVGGALVVRWPENRLLLIIGGIVVAASGVPALIGGVGLLYVVAGVAIEIAAVWTA